MRDYSERSQASGPASAQKKRLGGYLVEAGLLTPAQVDVALNDQKYTGMRFGEILAARGWVKQQTIEYLMQKVVLPEQQMSSRPQQPLVARQAQGNGGSPAVEPANNQALTASPQIADASKQGNRRDSPISKPLPSVASSDGDVSWVG